MRADAHLPNRVFVSSLNGNRHMPFRDQRRTCFEYFAAAVASRGERLIVAVGAEDTIVLRAEWLVNK